MRKIQFIISLALTGLAVNSSASPLWVRNGAGTSEYYIIAAKNSAKSFLHMCLGVEACSGGITPEITELASSTALNAKLKFLVDFKSDSSEFKTPSVAGAEILINQSSLFWNKDGVLLSYDLGHAVSLLVHAWGTQLNWTPERRLLVAERLGDIVQSQSTKTYLALPGLSDVSLVRFEHDRSLVVVEDASTDKNAISLSLPLASQLTCIDSTNTSAPIEDIEVLSAAWGNYHYADNILTLNIFGRMSYRCDGKIFRSGYKVIVGTKKGNDDLLHFDAETIKSSQTQIQEL